MAVHTVVIGSGFGGLAAALRLRARGEQVTVVDRMPRAGGRGMEVQRGAFRYDGGPTVITAPVLLEELFALFGERLQDHVELLPVKPWYQMRFADGSRFNYGGNTQEIQAEIAQFSQADAAAYPAYLAHCKLLFDKGYIELGSQAFPGAVSMLKTLPAMMHLRADRSVYALTTRYFSHDSVRRAFSIQPLLVGGNPFDTTSIYSLIHYLERLWGVWFPRGGTAALVQALVQLAERHGIRMLQGRSVTAIHCANQQVVSVRLDGDEPIACDRVVANADPGYVLAKLLPEPLREPGHVRRKLYSMGLFVWYFSTARRYTEVPHHSILFGQAYEPVLRHIFTGHTPPTDLNIYLHRPGATDPDYAPQGQDSFYALVPVPNLKSGFNWLAHAEAFKARLCKTLEDRLLPGLAQALTDEHWITPDHFASQLNSPWGSGFSLQPTLMQSAGFRYPNQWPKLKGLYFVGSGTHPGAGVPGVITSAKVVERLIYGNIAHDKVAAACHATVT